MEILFKSCRICDFVPAIFILEIQTKENCCHRENTKVIQFATIEDRFNILWFNCTVALFAAIKRHGVSIFMGLERCSHRFSTSSKMQSK